MPKNPEEQKNEENTFIREHIKSRPRSKKQLLLSVMTALLLGIVFGGGAAASWHLISAGLSASSAGSATADADDSMAESADAAAQDTQAEDSAAQETEAASSSDTASETAEEQELSVTDYQKLKYELYAVGRAAGKAVVTVNATSQGTDLFQSDYESTDEIMGLVVSDDGETLLILTQYEPLESAAEISVLFSDDTRADAKITGYDANVGLAILSVDESGLENTTLNTIETAVLKTSGTAAQGQVVLAIGSPLGSIGSILDGTIISNSNQISLEDSIYTIYTTSMLGAEDGTGVLINTDGEVIGIMMMAYNSESDRNTLTAVSMKELYPLIEKLMEGEQIAYLGVLITTVTSAMSEEYLMPVGVYVRDVTEDSPAFDAGIQPGDIIVQAGITEIASVGELMDYLLTKKPDQSVTVTVMRASGDDYTEVTCSVKLSQK